MAALAGVAHPWPYTLRELVWRSEAVRCDAWDRAALIACQISRGLLKGSFSMADFHPFMVKTTPETWDAVLKRAEKILPKTLTEAEILERWKLYEESH